MNYYTNLAISEVSVIVLSMYEKHTVLLGYLNTYELRYLYSHNGFLKVQLKEERASDFPH